jgi:pSer/pThr/pTyr-binding forkhead associated (FHA) protein
MVILTQPCVYAVDKGWGYMARELVIISGIGVIKRVMLEGESMSLGRSTANDLSYPADPSLSRRHLVFERQSDEWTVRDVGSKNGTLVNKNRISEAVLLQPGDRIMAGHLVIQYGLPVEETSEGTPDDDSNTSGTIII